MLLLKIVLLIILFWTVFPLPAMLTLPAGSRPGIAPMTIDEAAAKLENTAEGWELVEACRILIITRMQYCRRNSFDPYKKAFRRGYGYCQQQAYALHYLLSRLGFDAQVVHCERNRYPDGHIGGHAWVRVHYNGIQKDIDPTHVDVHSDKIVFVSLGKVRPYNTFFRYFAGWGSAGVNALRYYIEGKDR